MQSPAGSLFLLVLCERTPPTPALGTGRAIIERAVVHAPIGVFFLTLPTHGLGRFALGGSRDPVKLGLTSHTPRTEADHSPPSPRTLDKSSGGKEEMH
jgi:hypothetical protein